MIYTFKAFDGYISVFSGVVPYNIIAIKVHASNKEEALQKVKKIEIRDAYELLSIEQE